MIETPIERYAADNAAQTGTTVISPTSTITPGTLAQLFASCNAQKRISSVTDDAGNTWVVDVADVVSAPEAVSIASCQVVNPITTGNTITITWTTATSGSCDIWIQEVSGLLTASAFDKKVSAAGTSNSPSSGALATLATANEIVWGLFRTNLNTTWAKGAGFSDPTTKTLGGTFAMLEYQIVSAATGIAANGSFGTSGTWTALAAAYKGVIDSAAPGATLQQLAPLAHRFA